MSKFLNLVRIVFFAALASCLATGCTKEAKRARLLNRAESDFKSGAYDRAKIEYVNVLRLGGQDVTAITRLGQMWFEQGAPRKAGAFLVKARELSPNDLENRLRLARVYDIVGERAEARKEMLFVLQQSPSSGEALMLLAESAFTPEEIGVAEEALKKFPQKDAALYHLAAANMAMRKSDLATAQTLIARALPLNPKSPEAHQLMAILHLLQKDSKGAVAEFKTAADLAPPRSSIKIAYAEYEARAGEVDKATAFLQALTSKTPDFLSAWILLARIAFNEKQYDQALTLLENVFSRESDNLDARLLQSDSWLAKRETKKSIDLLEGLDRAHPGVPAIKFQLARGFLQDSKPLKAAASLREAISANPDYSEAVMLLAEINLQSGQTASVVTGLEELLSKRPDLRKAQTLLAQAYREAGRLEDAATVLCKQIEQSPTEAEPHVFLGLIQRQQKKDEEARRSFGKALELSPDNVEAVNQLVAMDLEVKDFAGAMRTVQRQKEKSPNDAVSYLLEGKVQTAKKEWPEAEAALKKAIELNPNLVPAHDLLAAIYLSTDKPEQASREVEAILSRSPRNQAALMTLASIAEKQNDYAKAVVAYEKLLAFEPGSVLALNNLAYLYAEKLNQPEKAQELARKARTLAPDNPAVADTLGWVLFKRGNYQQALELSQEAAGKSAGNPEVQFHLGMAHYMMGQTDAARIAFQRGLSAPEDFPSKTEAQRRLNLLSQATGGPDAPTASQMEEMLKQYPNDVVARFRLAEIYEKQDAFDRAAVAYEEALKSNPKLTSAALKLAQLYSGPLKNAQKALEFAKKARDLAPADPKVASLLGRVAFDTGNFLWAYSLLQESVRQFADDTSVLSDFAWAAYRIGKTEEAQNAMQKLVDADPNSPQAKDAREFLAMLTLESKPLDAVAAEPEINKILADHPDYVPALIARAVAQAQRGQRKAAVATLNQVLRDFPDFALAQKHLAALYVGDPDQNASAYELATKARKVLMEDPELAEILAEISYRKKEYVRAIQLSQEGARRRPLDAKALFYLGMSQLETKQESEGRETLKRALDAALDEPLARQAREAIEGTPRAER